MLGSFYPHTFLPVRDGSGSGFQFGTEGFFLATGSSDYSIKLWDYQKSELRKTISGLEGSPVMLTFSPNGRLLAEDGMSEAFHIYDLSELYD